MTIGMLYRRVFRPPSLTATITTRRSLVTWSVLRGRVWRRSSGILPDDTYEAIGQYRHPDNNLYDTSRALVVAPIVDLCNHPGFCPGNSLGGGSSDLQVSGFALVFVEGIQNGGPFDGDVVGRLIDVFSCGGIASPPISGAITYSVPVRLVRLP